MNESKKIDPRVLYYLAAEDDRLWKIIKGQRVSHMIFGSGDVLAINYYPGESPTLIVQFAQDAKQREFFIESFADGKFSQVSIDERDWEELSSRRMKAEQKIEANRLELESRNHYEQLKSKYLIPWFQHEGPISNLYRIILELEESHELDQADVGWLVDQELHPVLAVYYQNRAEKTGDEWDLVSSSSEWRKARIPEKSVALTRSINTNDPKLRSALYTTRGAALKDTGNLNEAQKCAEMAIGATPSSYYPFNLMGAIKFQMGLPEEGDRNFAEAVRLGSSDVGQMRTLQGAIEKANAPEQRRVADYLLNKDPDKYKWARKYLHS